MTVDTFGTDGVYITRPPQAHLPLPQLDGSRDTEMTETTILGPPFDNVFNKEKQTLEWPTLPPKRQPPLLRKVRHTWGGVYQRLFSVVFIANLIASIILFNKVDINSKRMMSNLATASAANIMIAVGIRQQWLINTIFKTCWIIPKWAPLRLRRMAAKCYEFGGIHSGAAVGSTVWFILLTAVIMKHAVNGDHDLGNSKSYAPVLVISWILLVLLVGVCLFALPSFRTKNHNTFEVVHRFAGWSLLALFWVELVLIAQSSVDQHHGIGPIIIREPSFWFLVVTTCFIVWPWMMLQKLHMRPEYLSNRAIRLHFNGYHVPPFSGIALSTSPLFEWHSFACLATPPDGGSVLISNGGDWTKETVNSPKPYYWVRGIPVTGVLNMAQVFKKVVIVTTGSGIGPVLSYLTGVKRHGTCRLIWSVPDPLNSYGKEIVETVKKIDSEAVIWDTDAKGRPDVVAMAYQLYVESDAEAVFVISNPKLTKQIVYGMETRGVPGFGPIWDS